MMRHPFLLFLVCIFAVACTPESAQLSPLSEKEESSFNVSTGSAPGIIRIKFKKEPFGTKGETLDLSALGSYTMTRTFPPAGKWEERHRKAGLHLWYDISFNQDLPLTKATATLDGFKDLVEVVETVPVAMAKEFTYPFNDPRLPEQWHYQNPGGKAQWAEGCDVNAFNAWTIETGNPQVIVAVNDKGVDYEHEDLAANMWINEAEYNGLPGEDDDNNGYVDDIYGYNFISYDGKVAVGKITPGDHGTHVAGTIGAVNNNGIGVGGVAGGNGTPESGVRLMVTQTLDDAKNGALTPASFVYAADNGAVLINCSWGFVNNENPTPKSYVEAINYFNEYAGLDENGEQTGPMVGGLVIFAAGNDGREIEHPSMDDNVFAVAALSANYVRSYYTSFGEWVDISAPGGDANRKTYVLSTLPNNEYGNMQGSSMAAPHATGVAALIVSHYGVGHKGFTRDKLIYLMQSTANKRALEENGSYATRLGAGLVDAYAALLAESSGEAPAPVTDLKATANSNAITLNWTIPGSEESEKAYGFNLYYAKRSLAKLDIEDLPKDVTKVSIRSYGKPAGTAMSETLAGLDFGTTYHFRMNSESLVGVCSELSDEVTAVTGKNTLPVIEPLSGTSMTLRAHQTGSLRFRISDADGHELYYGLDEPASGLSLTVEDENILVVTVDASVAGAGTYKNSIWVTDSFDKVTQAFQYTVLPNTPPKVKSQVDDQIFSSLGETRSFNLSDLFTDEDGEPLNYTVTSSSASIIVQTEVSDGRLNLTSHSYGMTELTVTATDVSKASAFLSFRVLVRNGEGRTEVYPNPFTDYLYVRPASAGQISVRMISSIGSSVFESTADVTPFDPAKLDFKNLSPGVYTLSIRQNGSEEKFTVVKK